MFRIEESERERNTAPSHGSAARSLCTSKIGLPNRCRREHVLTLDTCRSRPSLRAWENPFKHDTSRVTLISLLSVEDRIFRAVSFTLRNVSARSWRTCNDVPTSARYTVRLSFACTTKESVVSLSPPLQAEQSHQACTLVSLPTIVHVWSSRSFCPRRRFGRPVFSSVPTIRVTVRPDNCSISQ